MGTTLLTCWCPFIATVYTFSDGIQQDNISQGSNHHPNREAVECGGTGDLHPRTASNKFAEPVWLST